MLLIPIVGITRVSDVIEKQNAISRKRVFRQLYYWLGEEAIKTSVADSMESRGFDFWPCSAGISTSVRVDVLGRRRRSVSCRQRWTGACWWNPVHSLPSAASESGIRRHTSTSGSSRPENLLTTTATFYYWKTHFLNICRFNMAPRFK